jgi:hypothetical protein
MRTLSSTLLAAQKQTSSLPHITAVLSDYHGDISRLRFTRHYSGSEGDYYAAALVAGDGSLIRSRIDPVTKVLYTQRVTSPGPGSDFSSWSSHGAVSASGAVALAASGASVFLFFVDADTVTLKQKESTDNGASYGAATTVATAASAVTYLAAAVGAGGDRVLFWTVGAVVWKSRFSSGSWGAPAAWTDSAASLTGIACEYRSDWDLVVCGTATTSLDAKVWTVTYGDGEFQAADTWSALRELTHATASSNVTFRSPALEFLQHWRLFFVEKHTGSQAYARLQWSTMNAAASYDFELWREPAPFDYESDYGVAAAVGGGRLWLTAPAGVWSAASPSTPDLDVTADVIDAEVALAEYDGRARVVLSNNSPAGQKAPYTAYGAGALGALQRGARLQLSAGYRTAASPEVSSGPAFWVESIEVVTGPAPRVVVDARDAWSLLEQWRARRQFFWAAGTKTVSQLIEFICARAGLDFTSLSTSSAFTTFEPAFTIMPGQDGKSAVLRLLTLAPDEAIMRGATCTTLHPQPADASVYGYESASASGSAHTLAAGRYHDTGRSVNRVRVIGAGVFNEGFDFGEIDRLGERTVQVNDLNLTSTALAADRAASDLRAAAVRDRRDEITVFGVNCGQELYDVITLTDAQAGFDAAKRRVLGLTWRYATGSGPSRTPRYDMTLELGSP